MMLESKWHPGAAWPHVLAYYTEEIKDFVARLRRHVIDEHEVQNDVDEACHLIEQLTHQRDDARADTLRWHSQYMDLKYSGSAQPQGLKPDV